MHQETLQTIIAEFARSVFLSKPVGASDLTATCRKLLAHWPSQP